MNYLRIEQKTKEWWDLKVGEVSGTRFGKLISGRENNLVFELVNELLDGFIEVSDYVDEKMQFGNDNEEPAIALYEQTTGIKFERGGVLMSDFSKIHLSSPDAINVELGIIVEVKSTMDGKTQIERFIRGIDDKYTSQVINYFTCSDDVKEVHWISDCPFRSERQQVVFIVTLDTILKKKTVREWVKLGRSALIELEKDVEEVKNKFITHEF